MTTDETTELYHKTVKFDPEMPEEIRLVSEQTLLDYINTNKGKQALQNISDLVGSITIKYDPKERTYFERYSVNSDILSKSIFSRKGYEPSNTLMIGKEINQAYYDTKDNETNPFTFERLLLHEFAGHAASAEQKETAEEYMNLKYTFAGDKKIVEMAVDDPDVSDTLKAASEELTKIETANEYKKAFRSLPKETQNGLVGLIMGQFMRINSNYTAHTEGFAEPQAINVTNDFMAVHYGEDCRTSHDGKLMDSRKPITYQERCGEDNSCLGDSTSMFDIIKADPDKIANPPTCDPINPLRL